MQETFSHQEGKTTGGIYYRRTTIGAAAKSDGAGPRPTLVMVMGYGGSLRIWPETLVNKLAAKFDVVTYDNRGTGLSFLPADESEYSTQTMAGDIEEVVNALGLHHFHLMGYSMGGCIAIEYAHKFSDKVQSLFLLSTTAGGTLFTKPDKAMSYALANPPGKTLWEIYVSTFGLMYSPQAFALVEPKLKALYESSKAHPTRPQALVGHSRAFRLFDASAYVNQLPMPITILSGANDRLMPVQNSRSLAQALPQANLVIVPECEHGVHIEQEDLVVGEIEKLAGVLTANDVEKD
jgi:pimeloyl-ACP methyl ester carboxylesterase